MKKITTMLGITLFLAGNVTTQAARWGNNFAKAKRAAKREKKLIIANFTGSDFCGGCIALNKKVFSKKEFVTFAKKYFVLLEVDFPSKKRLPLRVKHQNKKLKRIYGVKGLPTILFLDASGKKLTGKRGYSGKDVNGYIKYLRGIIKKHNENASKATKPAEWITNFEQAKKEATKDKKLIFVNFTNSEGNRWCVKLHKEVLKKEEFLKYASEKFILLTIDFPRRKPQANKVKRQNKKLAKKYGIRIFPTTLILDKKGRKIKKTGYRRGGVNSYIKYLDEIWKKQNKTYR